MEEAKRELIRIRIQERLIKVKGEIAELKELTKPISPENSIGRISRMDAINNKSVNEAALRNALIKFKNLKIAAQEIDTEDFGNCKACGNAIAEGRIMFMPESTKCMACARR